VLAFQTVDLSSAVRPPTPRPLRATVLRRQPREVFPFADGRLALHFYQRLTIIIERNFSPWSAGQGAAERRRGCELSPSLTFPLRIPLPHY